VPDTAAPIDAPSAAPLDVPGRLGAFRALRHRNYRLYFFGQLTSLAGTWMQSAAQAWLVLRLTNSSMMLGVVSFANYMPLLFVTLFAGVVVDHVDRRRLIITTQTILMVSAFTLAALTWTGTVRVGHVMLLAALNGTVSSFDMPGRQSFVVEMVGIEELSNAIALNSMMVNGARMIGPAIAGVIIGAFGTQMCFLLNGLSFLAVIWSLFLMDIPRRAMQRLGTDLFKRLREGLAYVWRNRPIFHQLILAALNNGLGAQYIVLVPLFARDLLRGGARGYGFLMAIQGVGSVIGAATLASRISTRGIRNNLAAGLLISAAGIAVFAASPWIALSLAAQLMVGAGLTNFRASNNTLLQLFVDDELRGRVMSCYTLASLGMTPLGALEVGFLGEHLGPRTAVAVCSAATIICFIIAVARFKDIGSEPDSRDGTSSAKSKSSAAI